jgi:hypothetical protein
MSPFSQRSKPRVESTMSGIEATMRIVDRIGRLI